MNSFAWLLLTAKDRHLRDPARALKLAEAAADTEETGYILDTLAEALWTAGRTDEAVRTVLRAGEIDPAHPTHQAYYQKQAEKFAAQPPR